MILKNQLYINVSDILYDIIDELTTSTFETKFELTHKISKKKYISNYTVNIADVNDRYFIINIINFNDFPTGFFDGKLFIKNINNEWVKYSQYLILNSFENLDILDTDTDTNDVLVIK